MSTAATKRMTLEEFLALPDDDGVERWLVDGEVREFEMSYRNRDHGRTAACITYELEAWRRQQPEPRGSVLVGDAGVRLKRDPEVVVGIDVVYISPELAARRPEDTTIIDGVPVLVVEVLSPNDTQAKIRDKLKLYRDAEVKLVWLVDPDDRTVRIYRQGKKPIYVNDEQELTADPELPGFRVDVARLFE